MEMDKKETSSAENQITSAQEHIMSKPEEEDFIVSNVNVQPELTDISSFENLENATEETSTDNDTNDTNQEIVDKLKYIDSKLQALLTEMQNNSKNSESETKRFAIDLATVKNEVSAIKKDIQGDGHNRSIVEIMSDVLKNLTNPAVTPSNLNRTENNIKNNISAEKNNLRREIKNDFKNDLKNELSNKVIEIKGSIGSISQSINPELKKISSDIGKLQKGQSDITKFVETDFQTTLKQELKPLKTLETTRGQLSQLTDGIDTVKKTLIDKGLQLRQKFPAANTDEEVLCQLTEYGQTILTQLSVAARWYARSKQDIDDLSNIKAQAGNEYQKGYQEGNVNGCKEGRKKFVKELFNRFGDGAILLLDKKEGFDPMAHLNILADFLRNEGLRCGYSIDAVVKVNEENYDKLSAIIKDLPHAPANIRIVKSDYYLNEELLQKAECKVLLSTDETSLSLSDIDKNVQKNRK